MYAYVCTNVDIDIDIYMYIFRDIDIDIDVNRYIDIEIDIEIDGYQIDVSGLEEVWKGVQRQFFQPFDFKTMFCSKQQKQ